MAKLGVLVFHPEAAFTQDERREIKVYLKALLRDVLGYAPFEYRESRGYVIRCQNPTGRQVKVRGAFHQVFDFDVSRPLPKSIGPPVLPIRVRT